MALRKLALGLALVVSLLAVVVTGASAHGKPANPGKSDQAASREKDNTSSSTSSSSTSSTSSSTSSTSSSSSTASEPQVIDDSQMGASTATFGGANVLPSTRTIPHWFGQTLDPHNGITYGYNMAGADPNHCSGSACDVTITTDITPVNVVIDGRTFNGSDTVAATLASPLFATNNYGTTPFATAAGSFPNAPALIRGPGGTLSQGDAGVPLQLQDATMRAQFNKTGASTYHLRLNPVVHDAVTIDVPAGKATLLLSGRGVVIGDVNIQWWATRIQELTNSLSYADPTHLPIILTSDVVNFIGNDPTNCCVIGFHGAGPVPSHTDNGPQNGNGNNPVQTWAWASYLSPGVYARPNGGTDWALQDIHPLSHEIAEWADDPFINNDVEPWLTPTAPQYGCTGILETGDPVVAIGFAMGTNTFRQGPNPNGTQSADGYYHPEDEVYLPWFMRLAPNLISEPTQSASTNVGRYTLMGDLNPFPGFRAPATGC
jgi:hypothetical protein